MVAAGLGVALSPAAFAEDSSALAKRLHNAAEASSLDDPALKPWHLKLDVQLYDAKGKPSEQGTIEEWWSPDADKRVYATPSYSATEILDKQGMHRTTGRAAPPYLLDAIRKLVVHPMASADEIDGSKPELRVESFGKVKLDCVMLDQPLKNVAFPPLGLFPTFCLDQSGDLLRLSYQFGSESAVLNRIGKFQGRQVALDPSISVDDVRAVSAHIETLEGKALDPSIFAAGADLETQSGGLTHIGQGVMAGMILKKTVPVYPEEAKVKHISGAVHMDALIDTDGHIHRLRITEAPDPSLAMSALAAVREWMYKPYLLNGYPVEVETTITVNYNIGRE